MTVRLSLAVGVCCAVLRSQNTAFLESEIALRNRHSPLTQRLTVREQIPTAITQTMRSLCFLCDAQLGSTSLRPTHIAVGVGADKRHLHSVLHPIGIRRTKLNGTEMS